MLPKQLFDLKLLESMMPSLDGNVLLNPVVEAESKSEELVCRLRKIDFFD